MNSLFTDDFVRCIFVFAFALIPSYCSLLCVSVKNDIQTPPPSVYQNKLKVLYYNFN